MNDKLKFYRETLVEMTKEAYRKMPNELKIEESVVEADLLTKAIMKQVDEFEQEKTNMWSPNYDSSYNMTTTIIDHLGFEGNKQKVNPDYLKTEPIRTIVDNGPQYPSDNNEELDYVCKLTQRDIEHINKLINLAIDHFERAKKNPIEDGHCFEIGLIDLEDLTNFINNKNGVLDKCQKEQLDFIEKKQSKQKKSYEGTLGEYWKELTVLFDIKSSFEHWEKLFNDVIIPDLKLYGHVCPRTEFNIYYYKRVDDVYNSLGIEFIEDFVKACEKCEE